MFKGQLLAGVGILAMLGVSPLQAGEPVFADNFDSGNVVGSQPLDWQVNEVAGSGDRVRVVNQQTIQPASGPNCVELVDASAPDQKANPFFNHRFKALPEGKLTCKIQLPSPKQAPAVVELLTRQSSKSEPLFRLTFESNGKLSYNATPADAGNTTTATSVAWTPDRWQEVEIGWTADNSFTATVDGRPLVEGIQAPKSGQPSEIKIRAGGASISGQTAYADDILVEENAH